MHSAIGAQASHPVEPTHTPAVGALVTICYFDGDFGRPRGHPPDSVPNYSRIVVVIGPDGIVGTRAMGFTDKLPILDPNALE